MRILLKTTIFLFLICQLTGCSNDFLNNNLTTETNAVGFSNIYLSPDWQSEAYYFKLSSLKEADFEIVSKPKWLNVESTTGHLSDSIAMIQCSATKSSEFSRVGIFIDFMTVKAGGQQYKVPVGYITEGNPKVQAPSSLVLTYNSSSSLNFVIQNQGDGVLLWDIKSMPSWLALDTARLKSTDFYVSSYKPLVLPLKFRFDKIYTGYLSGTIVLNTNDKNNPTVNVNVTADMGTPRISIPTSSVDFAFSETSKTVSFYNSGSGTLLWNIENIPAWLTVTPSTGIGQPYTSAYLTMSCNRSKLAPGQNSATITLKTNDSSNPVYTIKVTANAPGSSANIQSITGNIVDALFNKNTNILYYVTSAPNKFVAFDIAGRKVLNEIPLSKAPTCLAISEDWTKAAVGHNGYISAVNLSSNTVTSLFTLDCSVNDITWAENSWFCYTQNGGSFSAMHWINTADGKRYDDPDSYSLDGATLVKKVPNQPYILATRGQTSPSGFFAYDISTKSKKSYAHMDLSNFWFSNDGAYVFARNTNIYRTTSSTAATTSNLTINPIAKINIGTLNYYGLQFVETGTNCLWVLKNESYSSTPTANSLCQVEDNDYTLVKQYNYDSSYQPDAQTAPIYLSANYVFENRVGKEIAIFCKVLNGTSWVIEYVAIK